MSRYVQSVTYSARCPACSAPAEWTAFRYTSSPTRYEIECDTPGCSDDPSWQLRHAGA